MAGIHRKTTILTNLSKIMLEKNIKCYELVSKSGLNKCTISRALKGKSLLKRTAEIILQTIEERF